jgi:hypothetical protein
MMASLVMGNVIVLAGVRMELEGTIRLMQLLSLHLR